MGAGLSAGLPEDFAARLVVSCPEAVIYANAEGKIFSKGPHGEDPAPPSSADLTPAQVAQVQAKKATAAIVMHYAGNGIHSLNANSCKAVSQYDVAATRSRCTTEPILKVSSSRHPEGNFAGTLPPRRTPA